MMNMLKLKVSSKSLLYIANSKSANHEQIVYKVTGGPLAEKVGSISKQATERVLVLNQLELVIGDTSAIWRSHQTDKSAFDALYNLLKHKPDNEFFVTYVTLS